MERMPYQPRVNTATTVFPAGDAHTTPTLAVHTDWKARLPVLSGRLVTLRELRLSDAASLLALLTTEEVSRFISPPPTTLEGFEKFIAWTHRQRAAGQYVCFAVVPDGMDTAVGFFQVRGLSSSAFDVAEWGFVLGSPYWGRGLFAEGAALVLEFVFETLGVQRLEARASTENGRGNGALVKVGATLEARLRQSFFRHGRYHDQHLWTILAEDWAARGRSDLRCAGDLPGLPSRVTVH